MDSFKWGVQFETGIAKVDEQHKSLVALINTFGQHIAENNLNDDFLFSTLRELTDYAQVHFDTEERIMTGLKLDVRHIQYHLQQHMDFVEEITFLADSMEVGNIDDYKMLFEYLMHWLVYHILGADNNMARQVNAVKRGVDAQVAYRDEEREVDQSAEPLLVALNGLFSLVSKRNKALNDLNRTLEKRVAERTAELVEANKTLEKISITDHLTGLPNRRFAMVQLDLLWEESQVRKEPLACLMIDADGFKTINDTYGHDAGDSVLKRLAKELKYSVRSDDIVCRLGGDEFVIFCPNTPKEGALKLAEATRKKVNTLQVPAGEGCWNGSVSIGVASRDDEMKDTNSLLKAADEAVYEAKNAGRNCVRG